MLKRVGFSEFDFKIMISADHSVYRNTNSVDRTGQTVCKEKPEGYGYYNKNDSAE